MRIFAYCARSFAPAMARMAGVTPVTCPPWNTFTFRPQWLEGQELIYFDLHGLPGLAHWFEEQYSPMLKIPSRTMAITAEQLRGVELGGAVVFCLSCYLEPGSPMLEALLDAGASYVIGGEGLNYGGTNQLMGADLLGYWFRMALERGRSPLAALALAKRIIKFDLFKHAVLGQEQALEAARDTLKFRAYHRRMP